MREKVLDPDVEGLGHQRRTWEKAQRRDGLEQGSFSHSPGAPARQSHRKTQPLKDLNQPSRKKGTNGIRS